MHPPLTFPIPLLTGGTDFIRGLENGTFCSIFLFLFDIIATCPTAAQPQTKPAPADPQPSERCLHARPWLLVPLEQVILGPEERETVQVSPGAARSPRPPCHYFKLFTQDNDVGSGEK